MSSSIVQVCEVSRQFDGPAGPVDVLRGVSLCIEQGEYLAIRGRSGSGKSTLLNLIAGLDRPTTGTVTVGGMQLHDADETALARWRGSHVGVVFQFFQLLPTLTVLENLLLAMDFVKKVPPGERRPRALKLLEQVGVMDQADKFPAALSGGEQQRVAVARALANEPLLLVADEPTGNLDRENADALHALFVRLVDQGCTVVEVTHEPIGNQGFTRTVTVDDGRLS